EWVVMHLTEFQDKPLKSIAKGDLELDWLESEEKAEEQPDEKVEALIGKLKDVLGSRITDVRITSRLTDSPACLVVSDYGLSRNLSRILKATGQSSYNVPPIMEINPNHQIIQNLVESDDNLDDWAHVLFDQAVLSEGSTLDDPADYVRRINTLLSSASGEKSPIILAP
ncbi:MAG: molecular chaperone HtpG, partial [Gammaproteobacteria bacterium]|nr:molecular chaperone HtpG [Gammaproteobacteria bacterium]